MIHYRFPWEHEQDFNREREISGAIADGLRTYIAKLEAAIRKHRDARGHNRCWLDDQELYSVLPETIDTKDFKLPPKDEFLKECTKYHQDRQP